MHSEEKIKPSGMDLAFQFFGEVTLADSALGFYQNFEWIFSNLDFFIVSTGIKIQTHEHLAKLNLDELKDLPPLSNKIIELFSENKEDDFLYHMSSWCELLNAKGLTHLNSAHLKLQLEKFEQIKLVKPCGALGADVLLVFFNKQDHLAVAKHLEEKKLPVVAESSDLAGGMATQLRTYWREHHVD